MTIIKKLNCLIFLYFRKKAKIYYINTNMGLPWYRVHTVVLNDPGRFSVHLHTALVSGWAGSMAFMS
jgi:hypothetical protein